MCHYNQRWVANRLDSNRLANRLANLLILINYIKFIANSNSN